MAYDATLYTEEDDPALKAQLEETFHLNLQEWTLDGDRGVSVFPLKTIKVLQDFFNLVDGSFHMPPVILTDFGATVEVWRVKTILVGAGVDPVNSVETKVQGLRKFIKMKSYLADRCFLKIGSSFNNTTDDLIYRGDEGVEGKVATYSFHWISKRFKIVEFSFKFQAGLEIDVW